ncbi:hypothetical protein [Haladaptatus sp. ZSTT2]|uniref:hypothetical protein n=1 Tax=Haladaptatus sp. ZSTT2 TaxID=3120515 RepID=UPI00300E7BD8
MRDDPPRPATLPPGYDEEDPYEDVDLSTYPAWWRENIEEFRRHEMRPYRPPRFADGEIVPPALLELEAELGVEIRLHAVNPEVGKNWEILVDGERIGEVGRTREGAGFTQYAIDAAEFAALVRDGVA